MVVLVCDERVHKRVTDCGLGDGTRGDGQATHTPLHRRVEIRQDLFHLRHLVNHTAPADASTVGPKPWLGCGRKRVHTNISERAHRGHHTNVGEEISVIEHLVTVALPHFTDEAPHALHRLRPNDTRRHIGAVALPPLAAVDLTCWEREVTALAPDG